MILMQWQANYSVNVPEIDVHHKHLFSLLNQLNVAMSAGNGNDMLSQILEELIDYTKYHFRAEENLMLEMRYPGLAQHIREHNHMLDRISKFEKDFSSGKAVVSVRLLHFLRDWLYKHILVTDKKYSEFMN